tara:strand:+ start:51 stop:542 length:492 start_codon:yes stop_codon:yes gene_type:complete
MPSKKQRSKEKKAKARKEGSSGTLLKEYGKSNNQELYVNVSPLFPKFPKWVIKTTSNQIEELIAMTDQELKTPGVKSFSMNGSQYIGTFNPKEKLQSRYEMVMENVNQYTEEQVNDFKSNNLEMFGNWCDDIAISYCMRVVLFELPIPIMSKPPQSVCQALFG